MKKTLILIISLMFICFVILWTYTIYKKNNNISNKKEDITKITTNNNNKKSLPKKTTTKKSKKRIEEFKERLQSKWLIIKWDIELKNKEYIFALQKFLQANKKTPNNPKIIWKIGEIYFHIKKFDLAYKYLNKNNNSKYNDMKILSYLYSKNLDNLNLILNWSGVLNQSWSIVINNIQKEIKKINVGKEDIFYYVNSLECIKSFHICKKNFENYFKNVNYSWKNKNLENIKKAIVNYKNSKIEKLYYKNALIIWSLFQNKNYPITVILSLPYYACFLLNTTTCKTNYKRKTS